MFGFSRGEGVTGAFIDKEALIRGTRNLSDGRNIGRPTDDASEIRRIGHAFGPEVGKAQGLSTRARFVFAPSLEMTSVVAAA